LFCEGTHFCDTGKHFVIKGGSFASTTGCGTGIFDRFHFRPHFHQLAGFRYVTSTMDEAATTQKEDYYETDELVKQYLHLHFGSSTSNQAFPFAQDFPKRCAELVLLGLKQAGIPLNTATALDVGCALGASSLYLSHSGVGQIMGIDLSLKFIQVANEMKRNHKVVHDQEEFHTAYQFDSTKVDFQVGNAQELLERKETYDAVLASNLLCRLPNPEAFLAQLPKLVNAKGVVVLISPYSWKEEFTPKPKWLGAIGQSDEQVIQCMNKLGFKLIHQVKEMPLLIQEHPRKFQLIQSHACVFQKL
jgi:putative 4-mercaptohistidine N1-methyltranferase